MAIPAYYSLIQRGSTGPDVALVQTWLNGLRDTCTWYHELTAKHGLHVPYPGIVLRQGSSGGTVRLVQQKLNALGEKLSTDGKYGASTAAAVERYQRRNGLTADGAVGKATWEKMF